MYISSFFFLFLQLLNNFENNLSKLQTRIKIDLPETNLYNNDQIKPVTHKKKHLTNQYIFCFTQNLK